MSVEHVSADGLELALHRFKKDVDANQLGRVIVLCLHAIGHDARDYQALAEHLSPDYLCYGLDWPGHGASTADEQPVSAQRYAQLLVPVMARLGQSHPSCPVILIGNSIGGAAAISYIAQNPHAVRKLVLCNSGGLAPVNWLTRWYCGRMARRFERGAEGEPGFPAWYRNYYNTLLVQPAANARRDQIVSNGPMLAPCLAQAWQSFAQPEADLRNAVAQLSLPVLFAWGRRDPVLRWRFSKRGALQAPVHQVELFDSGHSPFMELPDNFASVFQDFAAS